MLVDMSAPLGLRSSSHRTPRSEPASTVKLPMTDRIAHIAIDKPEHHAVVERVQLDSCAGLLGTAAGFGVEGGDGNEAGACKGRVAGCGEVDMEFVSVYCPVVCRCTTR